MKLGGSRLSALGGHSIDREIGMDGCETYIPNACRAECLFILWYVFLHLALFMGGYSMDGRKAG